MKLNYSIEDDTVCATCQAKENLFVHIMKLQCEKCIENSLVVITGKKKEDAIIKNMLRIIMKKLPA